MTRRKGNQPRPQKTYETGFFSEKDEAEEEGGEDADEGKKAERFRVYFGYTVKTETVADEAYDEIEKYDLRPYGRGPLDFEYAEQDQWDYADEGAAVHFQSRGPRIFFFVCADGKVHGRFREGGCEGGGDAYEGPVAILDDSAQIVLDALCAYEEGSENTEGDVGVAFCLDVLSEEGLCAEEIPHGVGIEEGHGHAGGEA